MATGLAPTALGNDMGVAHGVALGMRFAAAIMGGVFPGSSLTSYMILSSISGLQTVLCLPPSAAANTNITLSRWRPLMPEIFSPSNIRLYGDACW